MTEAERLAAMEAWISSMPAKVQVVARRFPPGTILQVEGQPMHVISFPEREDGSVGLGVTPVNPAVDYERAKKEPLYICPCCLEREHHA